MFSYTDERTKILAEFLVSPSVVMVPKDRPASWAPIEVEQILRDPSFDSRDTELDVEDGLAALSVLVECFAATLGTAYRRRAPQDFVWVELGLPRVFGPFCYDSLVG